MLSEKRTALSVLRTGSAIFVLPLSVLSLLIATAKSYQDQSVIHLLLPLLIICAALIVLAIFLIAQAIRHLRHYEQLLYELKKSHPVLGKLID
ncbi:MAG: hypothetical protein H7A51_11700 [Akkermansiaceae bacterium]|nr:hypothetical protein [Akkermansiaceae bacterium]